MPDECPLRDPDLPPNNVERANESPVGVMVVEDDMRIADSIRNLLPRIFPSQFKDPEYLATAGQVHERFRKNGIPPVLLLDRHLDEETPFDVVFAALNGTGHRVAVVLMSGSDMGELAHFGVQSNVHGVSEISVLNLPKPFGIDQFRKVIGEALAYVMGKASPLADASEMDEPLFDRRLSEFSDLKELVCALPKNPEKIEMYEGMVQDLSVHLVKGLEELLVSLDDSYAGFLSKWNDVFSRDPKVDRRASLLRILSEVSGADRVFDPCLHDVNNVLTPFMVEDLVPNSEEWILLKSKISDFILSSMKPFKSFAESGNSECFWSNQQVNKAIKEAFNLTLNGMGNGAIELHSVLDDSVEVSFYSGVLKSAFRTFTSNFRKVLRLSKKNNAEMQIHAFPSIDESSAHVYFVCNLKPFEEGAFPNLFDNSLPSEHGQGMGTGLLRTRQMVESARGSITSFHLRDGHWWKKAPGAMPLLATEEEIEVIKPYLKKDSTKIFMMELPVVS